MSIQLGGLVSQILLEHFGSIVQKVGSDLFRFGSKTIPLIAMTTNLPKKQIKQSLCAMIKYGIVTFEPSKNSSMAEYNLNKDSILCLLRYPQYILLIKNRYGTQAELILEEILQQGSMTPSTLILNILIKNKDDKEKNISVVTLRDTFISLITAGYIHRAPMPSIDSEEATVPILESSEDFSQALPEINIQAIMLKFKGDDSVDFNDNSYWKVNFDRSHQDFRDDLLVTAMTRTLDECGGELMRQLLQLMYLRTDPWAPTSNPIPFVELKDCCKKLSDKPLLLQYLDQYLKVMEESSGGVVSCSGEASGGQYTLKLSYAIELLVWDVIFSTIQERLGTKAARIFRLIKSKKYIEEEDIQKNAMLPAKESKQLTYRLLEEHFIEVQALRKTASGNSGPSKAYYLYYIEINNVANMILETIYKALYNIISRREHERSLNKWMIDKQQRVDTIVHNMRLRGEPEENIQDIEETVTPPEKIALERITSMIKKLSGAELHLCDTMFILEMYFMYKKKKL